MDACSGAIWVPDLRVFCPKMCLNQFPDDETSFAMEKLTRCQEAHASEQDHADVQAGESPRTKGAQKLTP